MRISKVQKYFYLALLLGLCALPLVLGCLKYPDAETLFEAANRSYNFFPSVHREVFRDPRPLAVALIGSSVVHHSINALTVEQTLRRTGTPDARAFALRGYFQGVDLRYFVAKELLRRKPVRLLVLALQPPEIVNSSLGAILNFGTYREDLRGLPSRYWATYYVMAVLNGPRHLLAGLTKPRFIGSVPLEEEAFNGSDPSEMGFDKAPFEPEDLSQRPVDFHDALHAPGAFGDHVFGQVPDELSAFYVGKLAALCRASNTRLAVLRVPYYTERKETSLGLGSDLAPVLTREGIPVLGIPPAQLFAGLSEADIKKLYYDDHHFNRNGTELFTSYMTPALLAILGQRTTRE